MVTKSSSNDNNLFEIDPRDREYDKCIIIDNGSGLMKAGKYNCNDQDEIKGDNNFVDPTVVFPTEIAETLDPYTCRSTYHIGDEIRSLRYRRAAHKIGYPIEYGIINDFEQMEKIWREALLRLRCYDLSDSNVILTEAPLNPKRERERTIQRMFECFDVQSFHLANQCV